MEANKIETYVPKIDYMLDGGIERGTVTYLCGPNKSGRTRMCCEIAGGAAFDGKNVVIISDSTKEYLRENISRKIKELKSTHIDNNNNFNIYLFGPSILYKDFPKFISDVILKKNIDIAIIDDSSYVDEFLLYEPVFVHNNIAVVCVETLDYKGRRREIDYQLRKNYPVITL